MIPLFSATRLVSARPKARHALILGALALGLAVLSTAAVQYHLFMLSHLERATRDLRTATFLPSEPADKNVVVVAITEETLQRFPYRSPVDRRFLAELLQQLQQRQVRAIGLDILFDQPTEPEKDQILRRTLESLTVPLVVGYVDNPELVDEKQAEFLRDFVPKRLRGLSNLVTDDVDSTVRWIYPGHEEKNGSFLPGFAYAVAERAGVVLPHDRLEIAWHGRPNGQTPPFPVYPAHLIDKLPPQWFAGKIVLIGAELSLTDRHRTPFAAFFEGNRGMLPGVAIFAHSVSQLIEGRTTYTPGWPAALVITLVFAILGAALGTIDVGPLVRFGGALLIVAVLVLASFYIFHLSRMVVPLVSPTLALGLTVWASDSLGGRAARKQREFIKSAFSRMVSAKVVDQLIRTPAALLLGGERRVMSFLFTDVANFTTMAEALGSERLGPVMNAYFDGVCSIVFKHEGTLDKFIGDAVFVIFNAPADQPDHAERAVKCALEIDRFAEAFRAEQVSKGIDFGVTRIGVHTGRATVGNFGSTVQMQYTAMGDAVNTASRLQGANKLLGTRLCVSGSTREDCKETLFRPLGSVTLKGKTASVAAYEPFHADNLEAAYLRRYEEAFASLMLRQPAAADLFRVLRAERPEDQCVAFHLRRIESGQSGAEIVFNEK